VSDDFRRKLQNLINSESKENGSNTPDFMLAQYLVDCLNAFDAAVAAREKWYGRPYPVPAADAPHPKNNTRLSHELCASPGPHKGQGKEAVMADNVVDLPTVKMPEWIVGPFEEYRVIIEGRQIPRLNALRLSDGRVSLLLDRRFILDLPNEGLAYQVATFVANALAIGEGYAYSGSTSKGAPFAPYAGEIKL